MTHASQPLPTDSITICSPAAPGLRLVRPTSDIRWDKVARAKRLLEQPDADERLISRLDAAVDAMILDVEAVDRLTA